ncbi:putative UDP-glucose 4-epimerase [Heterosigma akashiwo virus 01]|jgi:UDP-glucose 4-epimerase|uniref:Putative UDP-glucose 4-epimerase n=1 Tax=Heterosigma akashiwo virus 01 TaxID=97195 RepID=A0A1C9C5B7_HAV01|nr:nucleotide-sugar epimerase [Heterosigma akashiwo virus 01]AOM63477.1 putative UDP-glucose 4-epimerase [Heterosigma akashiwo virus 01]
MILITGHKGYIGSHLVHELKRTTDHVFIGLDNKDSEEDDYGNEETLKKVFIENPEINTVVHIAAFLDVQESEFFPLEYYDNNISKTLILLKVMKDFNIGNIVFISTSAVYADTITYDSLRESDKPDPISPYGKSKFVIEYILGSLKCFNTIVLRLFNVCGFLKEIGIYHKRMVFSRFVDGVLNEGKITINGNDYSTADGTCERDCIHVIDVTKAIILSVDNLLSENPIRFEMFNVGSGVTISLLCLASCIRDKLNLQFDIEYKPRREGDMAQTLANIDKINDYLGWRPTYRSSVQYLVENYLSNK